PGPPGSDGRGLAKRIPEVRPCVRTAVGGAIGIASFSSKACEQAGAEFAMKTHSTTRPPVRRGRADRDGPDELAAPRGQPIPCFSVAEFISWKRRPAAAGLRLGKRSRNPPCLSGAFA